MKSISETIRLPQFEEKIARSFKEDLINKFINKILEDRQGTEFYPKDEDSMKKFKKLISIKINSNPWLKQTWQLESFYKQCLNSKIGFGKTFYCSLKVK